MCIGWECEVGYGQLGWDIWPRQGGTRASLQKVNNTITYNNGVNKNTSESVAYYTRRYRLPYVRILGRRLLFSKTIVSWAVSQ